MGFDVTAANIIFFIAFLGVGSVALGAYWTNADHIEDARRLHAQRSHELAQTNLTVTSASYDMGAQSFTVTVRNSGSTVLDVSDLAYLLDGILVPSTSVASVTVVGAPTPTDVWLPLESVDVELAPVTSSPDTFQLVAANGARANWRS